MIEPRDFKDVTGPSEYTIVTCKECKHWNYVKTDIVGNYVGICMKMDGLGWEVSADDYCSRGVMEEKE